MDFLESLLSTLIVETIFLAFDCIMLECLLAKSFIFLLIPLMLYPNPNVNRLDVLLMFKLDSKFGPLLMLCPEPPQKFLKPLGLRLFLFIVEGAD